MGRISRGKLLFLSIFAFVYLQSCVKDNPATLVPPEGPDRSFVEEFDTVTAAYDRGWRYINVSNVKGLGFWSQGAFNNPLNTGFPTPIPFGAYSSKGTYVGFIGTDFTSTSSGAGVISNWLVSPVVSMKDGDKIIFYTRAIFYDLGGGDSTDFVNRLEVRMSAHNESLDVGSGTSAGDFDTPLLTINPDYHEQTVMAYDPQAYPSRWTRFEAEIGGLNGTVKGRFAFRYFVEGAGNAGFATGVGVDSVAYVGKK